MHNDCSLLPCSPVPCSLHCHLVTSSVCTSRTLCPVLHAEMCCDKHLTLTTTLLGPSNSCWVQFPQKLKEKLVAVSYVRVICQLCLEMHNIRGEAPRFNNTWQSKKEHPLSWQCQDTFKSIFLYYVSWHYADPQQVLSEPLTGFVMFLETLKNTWNLMKHRRFLEFHFLLSLCDFIWMPDHIVRAIQSQASPICFAAECGGCLEFFHHTSAATASNS